MTRNRLLVAASVGAVVLFVWVMSRAGWRPGEPRQDGSVKVLCLIPLTGPGASLGNYFREGLTLYREEHPKSSFEFDLQDSQSNPQMAVSILAQKLASPTPPEIVVSGLSGVSAAVVPKTAVEKKFTINTLGIADHFLKGQNHVQRFFVSAENNAKPVALWARDRYKRVALICGNDESGATARSIFTDAYEKAGNTVAANEAYSFRELDVRPTVLKALQSKPDAIFIQGFGPAYNSIFPILRAQKYPGAVLTDTILGDPAVAAAIGDAADGVLFVGSDLELAEPRTAEARSFDKKFRGRFQRPSTLLAAYGYDLAAVLDELKSRGQSLSPESFTKLGHWPGVAVPLTFPGQPRCELPTIVIQRRNGKNVPAE